MLATEKASNTFFAWTLGFSVLFHVSLLIFVMTTPLPTRASSTDAFENWVKKIGSSDRKAIILPALPPTIVSAPTQIRASNAPSGGSSGKNRLRKSLGSSGVLGIIGVASGSGSDSGLGNVFSANSDKLSDNLDKIMQGKQGAELPSSSNISRKALADSGSQKAADMGGIVSQSSGKVGAGIRQALDIPAPRVSNIGGSLVSGSVDSSTVLTVLSRKNSGFTRCYERALKNNPDLAGRVSYEISVAEEGHVLNVKFVEDTMRSHEVLECVKSILAHLNFPKPKGGPATFSSVLVFGTT